MSDRKRRQEEFVQGVLRRTSGSACDRAVGLLPELNEGRLGDLDRQLVQAHLEHCDGCRAVAVTLGWLGQTLPAMAELDPGPAFTAAVIGRTSGALTPAEKAVRAGATIGAAGLMDRLGRWWQDRIFRPQFPVQFAYVATVILVLLTALPVSPFRGAPEKARQALQAGPQSLPLVGAAQDLVQDGADVVFAQVESRAVSSWQAVETEWDIRSQRSRPLREQAADQLQAGLYQLRSGQFSQAGYQLLQAARLGGGAWQAWWHNEQTSQP